METNELKKLWKTLAEKQLIDQDLAKENILEIITRKGNGIISKMKRKIKLDYIIHLLAVILIPCLALFVVYWNNIHPDLHSIAQMGRAYTIIGLIEVLMVFGLADAIKNKKFLDVTFNTGSIKESMEKVRSYLKAYVRRSKIGGMIAMYLIFTFILIDIYLKMDGFGNLNFSTTGPYVYDSYFAVFVVLLMIALPTIAKLGLKRFTQSIRDIEQTLEELKEDDVSISNNPQ